MYVPPVYTQPIYQIPPNMYPPTYSPTGIITPHFQSEEDKKYLRTPEQRSDQQKLVYDVGTSPEPIIEERESELITQDKIEETQIKNSSPKTILGQKSNIQHSFAASPSDKTEIENKSSMIILDPITRAWCDALTYLDNEDFQTAYEIILSTGDDIYLLRLVSHTGPVIKYLHPKTAALVVKKMNQIIRCNIFSVFTTEWIEESHKTGVFKTFKYNDQNEYLDTLDVLSKDQNDAELSQKAEKLYQEIIEESVDDNEYYEE